MGYASIDWFEGPDIVIDDLATITGQLTDAMKPQVTSNKVKRVVGFFKRVGDDLKSI